METSQVNHKPKSSRQRIGNAPKSNLYSEILQQASKVIDGIKLNRKSSVMKSTKQPRRLTDRIQ